MTTWTLIVGCALVLALPLAWRVWRCRFDPFEPIVLFALAWGAMFVARPAAMLVEGQRVFWGLDVFPTLARALALALLGAVAFVVGYELSAGRLLAERLPRPKPLDSRLAATGALTASGLALVALAIFLPISDGAEALRVLLGGRSGAYGEALARSSAYVAYGSLLIAPAALIFTGLALRERTPLFAVAAGVTLALTLVRLLPTGGRIVLLPVLGGIFVLAYVIRQKRPRPVLLAVFGLVALVGSYLTLHLRDPTDDLTLRTALEELGQRPHAVFDPVLHSADAEMVLALSAALTVIPDDLSYRWGGATVGNLVTRPVPRGAWPGKPLPPSKSVVKTVWPDLYPGLNPAFSPLLGYYWDFWLAGVAVGMLLSGVLWRLVYEWFQLHRGSFGAQLIFASSLWFVAIGARNDLVDTLVFVGFLVVPVVAIVAISQKRGPTARAHSTPRAGAS